MKLKPIDISIELAEDERDLDITRQALMLQSRIVQEALASQKAELENLRGTIAPTIEKVLGDMLKPLQTQQQNQAWVPSASGPAPSGGGILNMVEPVMKLLGIGSQTPNQAIIFDLQSQFEAMTAQLWKLQLRKMKDQLGIPEHVVSESVHLTSNP